MAGESMEVETGPFERRVVVTRHGERLDGHIHLSKFACQPYETPPGHSAPADWTDYAFPGGRWAPFDAEAPAALPFPDRPVLHWRHDSPLTNRGRRDAVALGRQMRERGELPGRIFTSPAFRSVQTADALREGLGVDLPLLVEPSLYEMFTRTEVPPVLSAEELAEAGLPVDKAYEPRLKTSELRAPEPYEDYYKRVDRFVRWALERFPEKSLLLVAHSTVMDTGTRLIRGLPPLSKEAFWRHLMHHLNFRSYLSSTAIELRRGQWAMVPPPPQPTPELRATYDYRFMIPDLS